MSTETVTKLEPIPQPPTLPLLGNLREINRRAPIQSLMRLASDLGPIFRLELVGRARLIVSSQALTHEISDEQRFEKLVSPSLTKVRAFTGDGLFTSWTSEPNWRRAHSILMPSFGAAALEGYLPAMIDIADQLIEKWSRLNPDEVIDVAGDMTRLTLDTIGICGFDYRFNSFYREQPHPFIQAMVRALEEALLQTNRLPIQEAVLFRTHRRYEQDIAHMNAVVDHLISERRSDPQALATKKDLLNYMLTGVDKHTGERLDDLNIRYQIVTFLIAGHETTSGLLSFALYFLLKNPEILARAYEEVDQVLGTQAPPTQAQVNGLKFIEQILKESLRLWPTAPAFSLFPREDTTLGGRFAVKGGEGILVLLPMLHRDPAVWGPAAERFDPDRFAPEREKSLPPDSFKPFGNGQRACIGQRFAMQEAILVLGMILQRFELIDHTNYTLRVKETLTIKPDGFLMKVRPRSGGSRKAPRPEPAAVSPAQHAAEAAAPPPAGRGVPLLVLYGSNLGTAESIAQRIGDDARSYGFASTVEPLDENIGSIPAEGAVVIVCSSYNGAPPDNAVQFCDWLQRGDLGTAGFRGVKFTVFGCGDHHWTATYQAVPKLIDERLVAAGATRIHPRGEADAADDHDRQFREWYSSLWNDLAQALGLELQAAVPRTRASLRVETVTADVSPPAFTAYGARPLSIVANRELLTHANPGAADRSTRHIELALADDVSYHAGDHLGVLPRNRLAVIRRVLARFRLDGATRVIISRDDAGTSHLPLDEPILIADILTRYVELQEPATREQVAILADCAPCPPDKIQLTALAGTDASSDARYRNDVLTAHRSVLDLLEQFPTVELAFGDYLAMLPPLRPRYYSISSSAMINERVASITVGVVRGNARAGAGLYEGVASNYLAEQPPGTVIHGFVRGPGTPFRPPADPRTPMIMVGAGTGLAPFRGFLQERSVLKERGRDVGPSLLCFGCRNPGHDFIYEQELREFETQGLTRIIPAFSRVPGQPKCYVQHKIASQGDAIWALLEQGSVVYVCGDAAGLAPEVRSAFQTLHQAKTGGDSAAALEWLETLRTSYRFLEDVWGSG